MKNVTVTLPEEDARWVRVRAAENGRSVSRWLADLLQAMRHQEDRYEIAMDEALAIPPQRLNESEAPHPSRDSLHDRAGSR